MACPACAEPSAACGRPSLMPRQSHRRGQCQEHFQLTGARNQQICGLKGKVTCPLPHFLSHPLLLWSCSNFTAGAENWENTWVNYYAPFVRRYGDGSSALTSGGQPAALLAERSFGR